MSAPRRPSSILLFLLLAGCYSILVFLDRNFVVLDMVNIVIYVTGHLLGAFFGTLPAFAGGTLLTLIVPLSLGFMFLGHGRRADAAGMLFWAFASLQQTSVFIRNARESFTGVINGPDDWFLLLRHFDMIGHQADLAVTLNNTALIGMTVGIGLALIFLLHALFTHEMIYVSEN